MNQCPDCDKTFSSAYNMKRHYNNVHEDDEVENGGSDDDGDDGAVENGDAGDDSVVENGDDDSDSVKDGSEPEETIWDEFRKEAGEEGSLEEIRKIVVKKYIDAVEYSNKLRRDKVHKQITATKRKILDEADEDEQLDEYEALRLATAKRRFIIESISRLESVNDDGDDDEDDDISN